MLRSPLIHFLFAGALLFILDAAWSSAPSAALVRVSRGEIEEKVAAYQRQMGRAATPAEARAIERQVVDSAIWLDQAFELGLSAVDPVVRQRLLLNMRFLEGETEESDERLVARAIELGMDRSDAVVQRRLIDRVQAIIRARVRAAAPETPELEAYYLEHGERWRVPALLDLSHVYVSRDKSEGSGSIRAAELLERIQQDGLTVKEAIAAGDAFLAGHRLRHASPTRIVARLGPDFAEGVEEAPTETWIGPVESAFGYHLVWIHERTPSRIPAFKEVEKRVFEDWVESESRKALRVALEERRQVVEIRIVDDERASDRSNSE